MSFPFFFDGKSYLVSSFLLTFSIFSPPLAPVFCSLLVYVSLGSVTVVSLQFGSRARELHFYVPLPSINLLSVSYLQLLEILQVESST